MDIGERSRAGESELASVHALLVEASAWLGRKGVSQWQPAYPLDRLAREVSAGWVWFWGDPNAPIATVTLYERRPEYYPVGVWEDAQAAWYVCRFAVARRFAGQRLGEIVLGSLANDARAARRHALRLDVSAANPFLERYYQSQGFRRHRAAHIFDEPCVLLERTL